jgi:hypothetical protein
VCADTDPGPQPDTCSAAALDATWPTGCVHTRTKRTRRGPLSLLHVKLCCSAVLMCAAAAAVAACTASDSIMQRSPPKRLSMNVLALRSCLYSTSNIFLRCKSKRMAWVVERVVSELQGVKSSLGHV